MSNGTAYAGRKDGPLQNLQWLSKIGTIRFSKTDKGLITTDLMLHLHIGGNKTVQAV